MVVLGSSSQKQLYSPTHMALIHRFPVSECYVYTIHHEHDFSKAASHLGAVSLMPERCGVDLCKGASLQGPCYLATNWLWNGTSQSRPTASLAFDVSHPDPQQELLMKAFAWEIF